MLKKAVQQGRSKLRGDAYSVRYGGASERSENAAGRLFQHPAKVPCAKDQRQELELNGDSGERYVGFPALWSFTIDDDGDPIHSRFHRLTRPLQVSTLWHGLAGL